MKTIFLFVDYTFVFRWLKKYAISALIILGLMPLNLAAQDDYSLFFDGQNDYVNCGNKESLNITEKLTVEAWIKPLAWNSKSGFSTIIDKEKFLIFLNGENYKVFNAHSLVLETHHADGTQVQLNTAQNSIQPGVWQHVAVTYDGISEARIYINGEEQPVKQILSLPSGPVADHREASLLIGDSLAHDRQFNGYMDEIRIWNVLHNKAMIQANLFADLIGNETGLAGYWSMREYGTILMDYSGNENYGTLMGAAWAAAYCETARYPVVNFFKIISMTSTTALISAEIMGDGGVPLKTKGVCWNTSGFPMIERTDPRTVISGPILGIFTTRITGLTPNTTYFARVYATNCGENTAYSAQFSFIVPVLPAVETEKISAITAETASCTGNVTDDGNGTITARGVCRGISHNPGFDTGAVCTADGTGTGSFTSIMTGLTAGTTYFVRAYATNEAGTSYGQELSFTTLIKPTVITSSITNITHTMASGGGNVTDDGGNPVTARGVCWNTSKHPGIDNNSACTKSGMGEGVFISFIQNLNPDTAYHVRAYATNGGGTSYGDERIFKTPVLLGDVNHDTVVDLADAILILKILTKTDTDSAVVHVHADVNQDKKLGIEDVMYILRKVSGS